MRALFADCRWVRLSISYAIAIILTLGIVCPTYSKEQHLAVATLEYPPYTGKELPHYGYVSHIISSALESVGYTTSYTFLPWSRALLGAEAGDFDIVSFASYNPERKQNFIHSEPFGNEVIVFLASKKRVPKQWSEFSDLAEFRVGATRKYTYSPEFWEFVNSTRYGPSIVNTDMQNMMMLVMDRIALFPIDQVVAEHLIAEVLGNGPQDKLHTL